MPIYIYRCDNCGVQFERHQKFSDPPLTRCPECDKKTLRKVFQPVGIVFKGSGFYATDNRSPSGQSRSGNTSKSEESEAKSTPDEKSNKETTSTKSSTESKAE